ncbi:MAG TPA: hypothetical protein G4O17_01985, partial [Dehalococcoidia bacterium]|nr:hypothetical protein [Dehalococcoidia bacterium]
MKKKITKIWGIGLTFVMVVSLMLIAAPTPVAAADPVINEWDKADFPKMGEEGDWFWDPSIIRLGEITEATDGTLYVHGKRCVPNGTFYVDGGTFNETSFDNSGPQYTGTFTLELTGMWNGTEGDWNDCERDAFEAFLPTDVFVRMDINNAIEFDGDLPSSACLTGTIDVDSMSLHGSTNSTFSDVILDIGSIVQYGELEVLDCGMYLNHTVGENGWGSFLEYEWGAQEVLEGAFINGLGDSIFKSTDGGRTWEETDYTGGWVVDMVPSSTDADTLYVTDGHHVYKTDDAGDDWDCLGGDSLEVALAGDCGIPTCCCYDRPDCLANCWGVYPLTCPITSIDVGYQNEDPFVFIGTRSHCSGVDLDDDGELDFFPGSVYYLDEEAYGAEWNDMDLGCEYAGFDVLAVGCAPDFDDSDETYVVISDGSETWVVYTDGGVCEWHDFAELLWNCETGNSFGSSYASRIAFPDDWEDTETLFVGVVDCEPCRGGDGGDVYSVTEDGAIDRNVRPGTGGCDGDATDIISLDLCGDTDEGSLIAGAFCNTTVYYSTDGGFEWDPSIKHPTGDMLTYVTWYGDCGESALAATAGCEAAVSLSCVSEEDDAEDVGMSWNQISLIATIPCPQDINPTPEAFFMVTKKDGDLLPFPCGDTSSLFRYDGNWERVFLNTTYGGDWIELVLVSPDFADTETVFVTSMTLDIYRSQDAGCSWDRLGYPCDDVYLTSWAVLDEDTVYVGDSDGYVHMTDRHGSRPWEKCLVEDADDGIDAGSIVYFAFNVADDTMTILVGDTDSQVFLCEVDPDEDWEDQEWHLIGDCAAVLDPGDPSPDEKTCVVFDPGYAVTDDAGENMIYAAAEEVIARCIINPDEDWDDQEWYDIGNGCSNNPDPGHELWGIKVVGDTTLYVGDLGERVSSGEGVWRSVNPTEEDEDDVVFELLWRYDTDKSFAHDGLDCPLSSKGLRALTPGANGCPDSNVLWMIEPCCGSGGGNVWFYEDTLATPVVLATPADGAQIEKTEEVTLTWEALCDAACYEIELYR